MKSSTYIISVMAIALVHVGCNRLFSNSNEADAPANAVIDNIMTRTSVRSYSDRQVSQEQIETLLRAAMAAPTAGNKQPWRFVVINDRSILDSISEKFHSMHMAGNASVAVVMCGDTTATFEGEGRDYWIQDVSAASENLLLAAHAIGLGAVWCGIYPVSERVGAFSTMLGLPGNIIPMACICIGYPDGLTEPKDKWMPENIHYNTWKDTAR